MTADIEREIEHTRAELALTLDTLERKLAPRHLVEKGLDMVKDTFGSDYGLNRGLDMVRGNPVPFALIGIGAAWLIASNTGAVASVAASVAAGVADRIAQAERVGIGGDGSSSTEGTLGHTGNPLVDEAGGRGDDGWMHQMTDMAQGAVRSARDSGEAMLNRAGLYAEDGAGRVADQLGDAFKRHPLVIGAIGLMAGALIAALLPATRVEDEWVGGKRDELRHKAEEAGQDAAFRVREAAVRAADAADAAAVETIKSGSDRPSQA